MLDALAELTGERYETSAPALARSSPRCSSCSTPIGAGHSTLPMLAAHGLEPRAVLAGLGELERLGLIRRGFGGRYERVP